MSRTLAEAKHEGQLGSDGGWGDKLAGVLAELKLQIGGLRSDMDERDRTRQRLNQNILPLAMELLPVTASAVTDQPNLMGPRTGWFWDIHTAIGQNISGGNVYLYARALTVQGTTVNGVLWAQWTAAAGQYNWGKNQFLVPAGERIVLSGGSGLGAGASVSIYGTQIQARYYGEYTI